MQKYWMLLIGLSVCLATAATAAQTSKSGTISASQSWADTINVTGSITINAGTVTVRPGTRVRFMSNYSINVNGTGNLTAVGTAESTIIFTSGLASPVAGSWGTVIFQNLSHAPVTAFAYCTFEYGATSTEFRNHGTGTPVVSFDYCTFRRCSGSAIYVTQAWKTSVTHCTFRNLRSPAFFSHAVSSVKLAYCCADSIPVAFVFQGFTGTVAQKCTVNHCTIYGADIRRASGGGTYDWNGSAMAMDLTPAGTVVVTNSIVQSSKMLCGLKAAPGWTTSNDYNCWYDNGYSGTDHAALYSGANYQADLTLGSHSVADEDPLMVDPAHGDMRLQAGSPCIGKASDGTNIGSSQVVVASGMADTRGGEIAAVAPQVTPNPFTAQAVFTLNGKQAFFLSIFTLDGKPVKDCGAAGVRATWDGTDRAGSRMQPGMYVYRLTVDGREMSGRVMMTR